MALVSGLRLRLVLLAVTLLLATGLALLIAHNEQASRAGNVTATEVDSAAQTWARQQVVERLPDLTLPDLDGGPVAFREWSGRPLVINVWATWCAPCREEIPLLIELQAQYQPKELTVVGLGLDDPDAIRDFAEHFGINYPLLAGEAEIRAATVQLGSNQLGLPHTFFVAEDGTIDAVHLGLISTDQLTRRVDSILAGER